MFLKGYGENPEANSGRTSPPHQNREELLLRLRRSKMNPDPACHLLACIEEHGIISKESSLERNNVHQTVLTIDQDC